MILNKQTEICVCLFVCFPKALNALFCIWSFWQDKKELQDREFVFAWSNHTNIPPSQCLFCETKAYPLGVPCSANWPAQCTVAERSRYLQTILTCGGYLIHWNEEKMAWLCLFPLFHIPSGFLCHITLERVEGEVISIESPTSLFLEIRNSTIVSVFIVSTLFFPFEFKQEMAGTSQLQATEIQT